MTRVALALFLCLTHLSAAEKAPPAPIQYAQGRQVCTLANQEVDESSGIAPSRLAPGVFWTHNDSGDHPRLYAFNAQGHDLAAFDIQGAAARDWEDMASFTRGGKAFLLVADVGDNAEEREQCTLYLIPEPRLDPAKRGVRGKLRAEALDFRYEDGAHNCEAVAVDPTSKTIILVTKALAGRCRAYALHDPKPADEPLVAKAIAPLKLPIVTAMDISPDGLRAIVLTYGNAFEYTRRPDEKWAEAFAREPRTLVMPPRRQGEAVCYGPDGRTLHLTSEGAPCPLFEVPVAK
ncbi:MAG: hypothetical protein FJ290_02760 [Planctomycetes bacterium]|nr:hypothetical protein [Planctomycetota bacterium]